MMMGTREVFDYFECSACGSLNRTVRDLGDESGFYSNGYYSFSRQEHNFVRRWLASKRDAHLLGIKTTVGALLARKRTEPVASLYGRLSLRQTDRILDVGCGDGKFVRRLRSAGFSNVSGVDPFLPESSSIAVKGTIHEITEPYDVVTFNHSFEHVPDPLADLLKAKEILSSQGRCVIRLPTCSSFAFDHYGVNWVQIDAPRHLLVPSREGMNILAGRAGFYVSEMIDDSYRLQFAGSELYKKDVKLNGTKFEDHFSRPQLEEFDRRAEILNAEQHGDQSVFVLKPRA
jgi:SAM-dependent methyltransferase